MIKEAALHKAASFGIKGDGGKGQIVYEKKLESYCDTDCWDYLHLCYSYIHYCETCGQ